MTNDRFTNDQCPMTNDYFYQTGDLGRWLPAAPPAGGVIEFLGRIDNQAKIRGFRVEPGEIENYLQQHPELKDTAVITVTINNNTDLCAYFTLKEPGHLITIETLRQFLSQGLPDYMIPAYFVRLETLPRTLAGKIDKTRLPKPEIDDRAAGSTYVPARDSLEKILVDTWADTLGMPTEKLSITHNFFSLGGDSIKAIQLVSRLRTKKLKLELRDLLTHPTIAGSSPYVKPLETITPSINITGPIPASPIQKSLFETMFNGLPHHFNQSIMLFAKDGFQEQIVVKIFEELVRHHDALRAVFFAADPIGGRIPGVEENPPDSYFSLDVLEMPDNDDENYIKQETGRLHRSIDITRGPLVKLAIFRKHSEEKGRHLLMIIHHFIIDGVSWRILLEDFNTAYAHALKKEEITFPAKTSSYKEWLEFLQICAQSPELASEKKYWLDQAALIPTSSTPTSDTGYGTFQESAAETVTLNPTLTKKLLTQVHDTYHTDVNDIILTALALAIRGAFLKNRPPIPPEKFLLINVEGHGREPIACSTGNSPDITRTIGWFTSAYPLILQLEPGTNLEAAIRHVKEKIRQIRQLPSRGLGFGILKYLTPPGNEIFSQLQHIQPEINFNYLGQFTQDFETPLFSRSPYSAGSGIDPHFRRPFRLDITGITRNHSLELTFNYPEKQFSSETVHTLAHDCLKSLEQIIHHCLETNETNKKQPGETMPEIENTYSLSPMQKGMLFHRLYNPTSTAYHQQIHLQLNGTIDQSLFERTVNLLIERYGVFRTRFVYDQAKAPRQEVLRRVPITVPLEDISHLTPCEQDNFIENLKNRERDNLFDLSTPPLLRMQLIKTNDISYHLLWSTHHIIMDGWCFPIILKDLSEIYTSLTQGQMITRPQVTPYSQYIQWLENQDKKAAASYWQDYLEGISGEAAVPPVGKKLFKFRSS
jgi:non-ribosomal peptide synthase protein (TIGR01720 family)